MRISRAIRLNPIAILLVCCLLMFFQPKEGYPHLYYLLNELFGAGITSVLVQIYYAKRHKLCAYHLVALLGQLAFSSLNILYVALNYYNTNLPYYNLYAGIILLVCLITSIIFLIRLKYET